MAVVCCVLVLQGCKGSSYNPVIKLTPGDTYALIETTHSSGKVSSPTGTLDDKGMVELHYELKVLDGDSTTGYTIEGKISSGKTEESIGIGGAATIPFQNADGRTPDQEMLDAVRGKTFRFSLSPKGEAGPITHAEAFHQALKEVDLTRFPGLNRLPAQARKQLLDTWRSGFSDGALQSTFKGTFQILPDKPVRPGDSWTIPSYPDPQTGATVNQTLTLNHVEGKHLILNSSETLEPDASLSSPLSFSGKATGTITLDTATGLCTGQQMKMDLNETAPASGTYTIDVKVELFHM